MEIVYNESDLKIYMRDAVRVSNDAPVLLDRFLDDAVEVVDHEVARERSDSAFDVLRASRDELRDVTDEVEQ